MQDNNDLSFAAGDVIEITEETNDGACYDDFVPSLSLYLTFFELSRLVDWQGKWTTGVSLSIVALGRFLILKHLACSLQTMLRNSRKHQPLALARYLPSP